MGHSTDLFLAQALTVPEQVAIGLLIVACIFLALPGDRK
jgi:hypothetical protein